jgi:membrane protein
MLEKLFGPLAARWAWVRTALSVQARFSEIHGNYLASTITLAAFLSLFPLLLVATAVLGFFSAGSPDLAQTVIRELGVTDSRIADVITNALRSAENNRRTASIIGLAGLLWAALGLVGALQYAFNEVWQVKGRGIKDKAVGLVWLVGAGLILIMSFSFTAVLNVFPAFLAPLSVVAGLAVGLGLFLWSSKVLPNRQLHWRELLPGAVLGAIGLEVLKLVGTLYVPRLVASSSALYGSIGVAFALLVWLLFFGRVLVYSAALNVVRWEENHGTVRVEVELPRLPGEVPLEADRSGDQKAETTSSSSPSASTS